MFSNLRLINTSLRKTNLLVRAPLQKLRAFSTEPPKPVVMINHEFVFANISEMQVRACEMYAANPAFGTRVGDKYEWITYKQFGEKVQLFRNVLSRHQIGKDDKVALISNNRVEWAVAIYATMSLGAQLVPMCVDFFSLRKVESACVILFSWSGMRLSWRKIGSIS